MPDIKRFVCIVAAFGLILAMSIPALGAPATVKKSVQELENGNYLIKLVVTSTSQGIYAFQFKDTKASVIDVYAPKGWCILSDGEMCLSRTSGSPIAAGKSFEFVIHSTNKDAEYVWTFYGPMNQIGKPEVL